MRKLQVLICAVLMISMVLYGCKGNVDNENIVNQSDTLSKAETNEIIYLQGDYQEYKTLGELISACDYVIIGKVNKVFPTIRENISANSNEFWANYTPSQVIVEKVIVGNKAIGDYVYIRQRGGSFSGISENDKKETITEIADSVIFLEENRTYLMFVSGEGNAEKGIEYPYYLIPPTIINPKIVDGKLIVNNSNSLFENGTSIENAVEMIEEAAKPSDLGK